MKLSKQVDIFDPVKTMIYEKYLKSSRPCTYKAYKKNRVPVKHEKKIALYIDTQGLAKLIGAPERKKSFSRKKSKSTFSKRNNALNEVIQ